LRRYLEEKKSPQTKEAATKALLELSALSEGSPASELILSIYSLLAAGKPLSDIFPFNDNG
jgi:hypothetical protein